MKNIRLFLKNKTVKMLLLFYILIIFSSFFLILFSYFRELQIMEEQRTQRLKAIVTTLAVLSNASDHENLINEAMKFQNKSIADDQRYVSIKNQLKNAQLSSRLKSPIYTLFYHKAKNTFCYGVRSDDKIFLFDEYKKFPKDLLLKMNQGGVFPKYQSENGTWISAFHPIKNKKGKVVSLIEADEEFSSFLNAVNKLLFRNVLFEIAGILLISAFFFPFLLKIFKQDQLLMSKLTEKKERLQTMIDESAASLRYASTVQKLLLPSDEQLENVFYDHFVIFQPKDSVSGDFYWMRNDDNYIYFALADCTGHGIPGAILSVLGINILNKIYDQNPKVAPNQILEALDEEFNILIGHSRGKSMVRDGMEIGLMRFDKTNKVVEFSGAGIDLVVPSKKDVKSIKGNRLSIGASENQLAKNFDVHTLSAEENSFYYLFSDGFKDQFGGDKNKKYSIRQLMNDIMLFRPHNGTVQKCQLEEKLEKWKEKTEQTDDISLIGFRLF